jgi:ABC-type transport system involved in multi-copper enzyme maturation permease subunit
MLEIIKSNFIRTIKSGAVLFILFAIFMQSYLWIHDSKASQLDRYFTGYDYGNNKEGAWKGLRNKKEDSSAIEFYSNNKLADVQDELMNAHIENNLQEITRLESFYILMVNRIGSDGHPRSSEFKKEAIDLWNQVSGDISYDEVDFSTHPRARLGNPYEHNILVPAKMYYYLHEKELEPLYINDIRDITYLVYYFHNILPYWILIGIALLWYNSVNKEKSIGSLKLVLTQSVTRKKYYLGKWLGGVLGVSCIFLILPFLVSMGIGLLHGFASWNYPMRMHESSWTSFKPLIDFYNLSGKDMFILNYNSAPFGTDIVPFYLYLLSMVVVAVLFIGFLVALTQFISALINNERLSLLVVGLVYGLSLGLSKLSTSKLELNLVPTGLYNVCKTVGGNQYVTALGGSVILIVSTIVTLGISIKYFDKKHI